MTARRFPPPWSAERYLRFTATSAVCATGSDGTEATSAGVVDSLQQVLTQPQVGVHIQQVPQPHQPPQPPQPQPKQRLKNAHLQWPPWPAQVMPLPLAPPAQPMQPPPWPHPQPPPP